PPHDGDASDTSIGTLQSMSPEQLHGEALTPASDLFSLATVLYEALTGRVPYPGTTPEELSAAHVAANPPRPSALVPGIPDRLDAVLLQALRRDPASRFHSAAAMARALGATEQGRDPADDETRVIAAGSGERAGAAPRPPTGYVPPPVSDRPLPAPRAAPARTRPGRARPGSAWNAIGTLFILGAAALVLVLVVLPLLSGGGNGGVTPSVPASAPASAGPPSAETGVVPDTIGLPTDEAIDLAEAAGLDWTVRCDQDPQQPEGIIDQEPPAGTQVAPGSQFTMFSARIRDCR
ncbi:MAG TPA: PASTA domain-containing protein, partial [Candidatus Limnocylindria bacterium]|nr:PASTA domain-containing protein [Candidatus Limnocylindria bacterium]